MQPLPRPPYTTALNKTAVLKWLAGVVPALADTNSRKIHTVLGLSQSLATHVLGLQVKR